MQKIRFENGLAVAKSKIEYVMCRIEEIRLQLQGFELKEEENCSIVMTKGVICFIKTQWTDERTSRLSLCHN